MRRIPFIEELLSLATIVAAAADPADCRALFPPLADLSDFLVVAGSGGVMRRDGTVVASACIFKDDDG